MNLGWMKFHTEQDMTTSQEQLWNAEPDFMQQAADRDCHKF